MQTNGLLKQASCPCQRERGEGGREREGGREGGRETEREREGGGEREGERERAGEGEGERQTEQTNGLLN